MSYSSIKKYNKILATIILSSMSLILTAQEDDIITAPEVLIISQEEKDNKNPDKTKVVISKEDIKNSSASNIGDLFKDVPGVTLLDNGIAGMKRVRIRGDSSSRVLVIIDGVKVTESKSMDGSPLLLDLDSIEKVEVIKGSASAMYGSEAIAGVILITTKKGGEKPFQAELGVGYDSSDDRFNTYGSFFGEEKGFSYRFGGSYLDAQDRKTSKGEVIPFTDYGNYSLNNYLGYDWGKGKFSINQQTYRSHSQVTKNMSLPSWDRDRVSLFLEDIYLSPIADLNMQLSWQRVYKDLISGTTQTENTQQEAYLSLDSKIELPWNNKLTVGLNYEFLFLDSQSTKIHKAYENTLSFFAHDVWEIRSDLSLLFGLRYSYLNSQLFYSNDPKSPVSSSQNNGVVGSLGIVWDIIPDYTLSFSYSNGIKNPAISQKFIATSKINFEPDGSYYLAVIEGNPNLTNELSHNVEINFSFTQWDWFFTTAFAYNLGSNYIALIEIDPVNHIYTYQNIALAHTFTWEIETGYEIESIGLMPYINASYNYRYYIDPSYQTSHTGTPPWQIKGGLVWEKEVLEKLSLRADANIVYNSTAINESSPGTSLVYEGWYTINLGFGLTFPWSDYQKLNLSLGVNNILDKKYLPSGWAVPASGRSFFINASLVV